jgi:hypothetical protein
MGPEHWTNHPEYRDKCMATYRYNSWAWAYCTKPKDPQHTNHVAHDAAGAYLFGWSEPAGELPDPEAGAGWVALPDHCPDSDR